MHPRKYQSPLIGGRVSEIRKKKKPLVNFKISLKKIRIVFKMNIEYRFLPVKSEKCFIKLCKYELKNIFES